MSTKTHPFYPLQSARTEIHEHLTTLHMLTVEHDCKTVLELGTGNGQTTVALAWAARAIGGRVITVDIEPCHEARELVKREGLEDIVSFIHGDSRQIDWREPIDHLFIDSSHEYAQTRAELALLEPRVRKVLTMHDTVGIVHEDVRRATVDHFAGRSDVRFYEYLNNNGLFVISKKGAASTRGLGR